MSGETAPIELYANPTSPTSAGVVRTILEQFLGQVEVGRISSQVAVKQMLESQLSSLQNALHDQGLPVAKVEVVQGSQLSFSDLGAGQSSSQQHLESGKSQLPPSLSRYETREEAAEAVPQEARIYAPSTSRSLNLVA